jgi:hypothetical protein
MQLNDVTHRTILLVNAAKSKPDPKRRQTKQSLSQLAKIEVGVAAPTFALRPCHSRNTRIANKLRLGTSAATDAHSLNVNLKRTHAAMTWNPKSPSPSVTQVPSKIF